MISLLTLLLYPSVSREQTEAKKAAPTEMRLYSSLPIYFMDMPQLNDMFALAATQIGYFLMGMYYRLHKSRVCTIGYLIICRLARPVYPQKIIKYTYVDIQKNTSSLKELPFIFLSMTSLLSNLFLN